MEDIVQANIFFFIATICFVVLTIALSILSYYGIKVFRNISKIIDTAKTEFDETAKDFHSVRQHLTGTAHRMTSAFDDGRQKVEDVIKKTSWQEIMGNIFLSIEKIRSKKKK